MQDRNFSSDEVSDINPISDVFYAGQNFDSSNLSMGWLLPLLLLVLTTALFFYFSKGCSNDAVAGFPLYPQPKTASGTFKSASSASSPSRRLLHIKLNDGNELAFYNDETVNQILTYIKFLQSSEEVAADREFNLDSLHFIAHSAAISDSGIAQLYMLATILKNYPNVKIQINAYTDRTGDSVSNIKLSQLRAEAVANFLKKEGVAVNQVAGTTGYGFRFAHAAADAPDSEKIKDIRTTISIKEK